MKIMRIQWKNLTDDLIQSADFIEAVDPATRRAFRIWHRESPEPNENGTRIETLVVYMPAREFGDLKSRVRAVKGCRPAVVECVSL
jgi:hypothetical protein